jgi:AcrR family transcriptional regulator
VSGAGLLVARLVGPYAPGVAVTQAERSDSAVRVLDAALELFTEHGFDGTSLQQIADRLGVTKAAVYYHFRSKDDLLSALVEPAFDELHALLTEAEALPRDGARQKLALQAFVEYLLRHRGAAAWMSRDAAALTRPVVWERSRDTQRRLDALLTLGDSDPLARFWTGAITRAVSGAVLGQPDADEAWLRAEVDALSSQLLAGYRAARRRHG